MQEPGKMLTTREYAALSGLSVSTITKRLRQGTLEGEKKGGKWMVAVASSEGTSGAAGSAPPKADTANAAGPAGTPPLSVEAFSDMTYLTAAGVRAWLKKGILKGSNDSGEWRVDASNLETDRIRRLLRSPK